MILRLKRKEGELFFAVIYACTPMAGQKERGCLGLVRSILGRSERTIRPFRFRYYLQMGADFAQLPLTLTLYHNQEFVNMKRPKIKFDILTLFPDIVYDYASESILKRAQKAGLVNILAHNFRDFTKDKQRHVDDRPYGGGAGMILQVQPIYDCLKAIKARKGKNRKTRIIIMDPAGKKFDQRMAEKFSKLERIILICGRYEGFDERVYKLADEKISVGDYVLSGGELPALTIVEAVSRLVPGVLGNEESLIGETHSRSKINPSAGGLKSNLSLANDKSKISGKYPVYTRPENFMGFKVPKVLLEGDHAKIAEWRKKRVK